MALGLFVLVLALGLWRGLPLAEVLMVAISQRVSMVPEGLPVAMTVALAVGMQRMAASGAIIRRLSAVETLGSGCGGAGAHRHRSDGEDNERPGVLIGLVMRPQGRVLRVLSWVSVGLVCGALIGGLPLALSGGS